MKTDSGNGGSILVVVLCVVALLAGLAVAVHTYVAADIEFTGVSKNRAVAELLAHAGVEAAVLAIAADTNAWDALSEEWCDCEKRFKDVALGDEGCYTVCHYPGADERRQSPSDRSRPVYGLADEERRVNINSADRRLLEGLLESAAGVGASAASEIAAAIVDWRDPDRSPSPDGVESDYYQRLAPPYRSHDAPFDSVWELRLVRGITPAVFRRLEPYVTVYGTGKLNLNTADRVVLIALFKAVGGPEHQSAAESLAAKIEKFRAAGDAFNEPSAGAILATLERHAGLSPAERTLFAAALGSGTATIRSTCFRAISTGWISAGTSGRLARQNRTAAASAAARFEFVIDRNGRKFYWRQL